MKQLISSRLVGFVLLTLLLVGSFEVWWFWPSRESESAKAQAITALLAFFSSILVATITWIYVRTTYEMLELQRRQLDEHRPKVTIVSDWAKFDINGPIENYGAIRYTASWRAYFSNRSLTTATTVRILGATITGLGEQTLMRAYFQTGDNANATAVRRLDPGEASPALLIAEIKVPNRPNAQPPEPAHFRFSLSDVFSGDIPTPELQANVE